MIHVILPTDLSGNSYHAALYAARLLGVKDVRYTLVHTYIDADPSTTTWSGMADSLYRSSMDGMAVWEQRIRASEAFAGAELATEVLYGPLVSAVNALGEERAADLVAMGTLGHTGAGILGSNAAAMVKQSRLPVLVVPQKAAERTVRRILFADDQKGVEVTGTRMLLNIALRTGAEVLLAHVLREGSEQPDPELVAMYDELLQAIPHRYIAAEGKDVAAAVDLLAEKEGADLIAVLHRHTGFFEGLFHTSTAKRLALNTNVPLLVLQDRDGREQGRP